MNVKRACLAALVVTLTSVSLVRAQPGAAPLGSGPTAPPSLVPPGPLPGPGGPDPRPGSLSGVDGAMANPGIPKLSDFIMGSRAADCCERVGGSGPMAQELFVRWGPSFRLPAGFFGKTLTMGWEVQGGGRMLFFNQEADAAWTVELGLSNISNHGQHDDQKARLRNILVPSSTGTITQVPSVLVSVAHLNRTYVNAGFGREWYFQGSGFNLCAAGSGTCDGSVGSPEWMCRFGVDIGGRWGTAKLELHEIRHRTDTIGAVYFAAHTDVEIPWGCCLFTLGGRLEYDFTWMDILQRSVNTDIQSFNLLMTLGVRF